MLWRVSRAVVAALLVAGLPAAPAMAGDRQEVGGLTVEHQAEPLGIDVAQPRLGWILSKGGNGESQTAYEVKVEKTRGGRADVWDSGKIRGATSYDIHYTGPALASRTKYFWQVRVWDAKGRASAWSAPAAFETSFVQQKDFQGQWIGARDTAPALTFDGASWIWYPEGDPTDSVPAGTRYFRRTFEAAQGQAELQITADDSFVAYVNGTLVARSPDAANTWTTASIVDVPLKQGTNVIAVQATNTTAGPAGLLATLKGQLVTDAQWKTSDTEQTGWEQPAFDDGAWTSARVGAAYGSGPWGSSVSAPATPETLLRDEFAVAKPVAQARVYIAGLGYNKLYLNSRRVGDHELDPGFTVFSKTVLYSTYDVTESLRTGANAIGVSLGRGFYSMTNPDEWKASSWWGEPKLKLELDVTYRDGTTKRVVSGDGWKVSDGPTIQDSLWFGETYDARREQPGWNAAGFADQGWRPAVDVAGPAGTLRSQAFPPIKVTEHLKAVSVTEPVTGAHVYDFGTTTSGWARIGVRGPAGSTVRVTYGEKLRADGTVDNTGGFGVALQTYDYTLKGGGLETYQPSYSYAGFRYAQVQVPAGVTLVSVDGERLHTAVDTTGGFTSSDGLLNRYQDAQADTVLNNLYSIPTDTPMYEKRPYTADGHLYADSAIANFDMENFYESWMRSHRDDQNADGSIGATVPSTEGAKQVKDPIWSGSFILINWDLYWYYGDTGAVADNYDAMKAWLGYFERTIAATGNVYTGFTYGDWLAPGQPAESTRLYGTAYIYLTATRLATMARALGHEADARHFDSFASTVATTFNATFLDRTAGVYYDDKASGYRQTANLLPLAFGLVPAASRTAVAAHLVSDVEQRGDHLNTGALGTKYILPVLTDLGYGDLAYRVATNPTYPGWGHWFQQLGATTMWEQWEDDSRSHDHAFMGTVDDWLYQRVAGITPTGPGYSTIDIKPYVVGNMTTASGHVDSPFGEVSSAWTRDRGRFTLRVVIPSGATATVSIPARDRRLVTAPAGATFTGLSSGYATYTVSGGTYVLSSTGN